MPKARDPSDLRSPRLCDQIVIKLIPKNIIQVKAGTFEPNTPPLKMNLLIKKKKKII